MSDTLRTELADALGPSFVLGSELSGGMSRIFVATDTTLGRRVVVKTLGDAALDGPQAARFRTEILLAAGLQHPNIVPVLSAGTTRDGMPYYTMPYVEGITLRQRLAQGALPPEEVTALLRDVARALGAAHRRGIVHRDIKPENIFIADGVAVVSDFGVAKAIDATGATTTGVAVGTPAYMAPEQAAAEPSVGPRTDLYALGLVGWELLAGRHPFAGRPPLAMFVANLTEPVPSLLDVRPEVPDSLATLIEALVEKEPARRPSDAETVVATCTTLIATRAPNASAEEAVPIAASDSAAPRRGASWNRSLRSAGLQAGAVLAIAVIGAALFARWRASDAGGAPPPALAPDAVDWSTVAWLAPITAVRVPPSDSAALRTLEPSAARVRAVAVERDDVARTPDSLTVLARTSAGMLVFSRPGGPSLAALPLTLPPAELQSRAAGVLAILSSDVIGDWTFPRGAPPRIESVERFLALERIRLLRQGHVLPELEELYEQYDRFVADVPDWAAPMLLVASRMGSWPSRERYIDAVEARRAELTQVEQMLIDLFRSRVGSDMGGQLAVLRDLVRTSRFTEFGRAYGGVLGDSRQLSEAAAVLRAVGPGAGREHLPYWQSLITFEHIRGAHERALEAAESNVRESGTRIVVRWRKLLALAALRRTATLREEVAELATLPRDPNLSVGWVLTTIGDELLVHGDSASANAYRAEAMRWFDALRPGDRTVVTEIERAQLESRRGAHAAAGTRIDSLLRRGHDKDLLALRALIAVRARQDMLADSLLALWSRVPPPKLGAREVLDRSVRLTSGALPGDSAIVAARVSALRDEAVIATGAFRRAMEGLGWRRWSEVAHFDPDFARIRDHPDFRAVIGTP